jgi:hypothetical protein
MRFQWPFERTTELLEEMRADLGDDLSKAMAPGAALRVV